MAIIELESLLKSLKLKAIYWVDDENVTHADMDVDKLVADLSKKIPRLGAQALKKAIGKTPAPWRPKLKLVETTLAADEAISANLRTDRVDEIAEILTTLAEQSTDAKGDLSQFALHLEGTLSVTEKVALTSLFQPLAKKAGFEWKAYSFSEWERKQTEILKKHSLSKPALILLDQENTRDRSSLNGDQILKSICTNPSSGAGFKFLVVTNTCAPEGEYEHAAKLARSLKLASVGIRCPLFTLSKTTINQNVAESDQDALAASFVALLYRLKLSLLNQSLANLAKGVLSKATEHAFNRLTEITLHEFMYAITQSAQIEGVSELDTLLRLLAVEQRDAIMTEVVKNVELRKALERIRAVPVSIRKKEIDNDSNLSKLRAREVYWPDDTVNKMHQPICAGDIFQHDNGTQTDYYVLLGNDCDLMLRADGKRSALFVLLAKLEVGKKESVSETEVVLECALPQDKKLGKVSLNKFISIRTEILDLCWLNPSGDCDWSQRKNYGALPLLKSQQARLLELDAVFSNKSTREKLIASSPLSGAGKARVGSPVKFALKRINRLNAPYAQGILTKFAAVFARPSYDHDYSNIRENEDMESKKKALKVRK